MTAPLRAQEGLKIGQDVISGRITSLKHHASLRYLFKAADVNNSALQPSLKGSRHSLRSLSATRLTGTHQIVNQDEKPREIQISPPLKSLIFLQTLLQLVGGLAPGDFKANQYLVSPGRCRR